MEYILGVIVSLIAQGFNKAAKGDKFAMYVFVLAISIVSAGIYTMYKDTELFATFILVLTTAGAFHNFVIRRFE